MAYDNSSMVCTDARYHRLGYNCRTYYLDSSNKDNDELIMLGNDLELMNCEVFKGSGGFFIAF